MLDMDDEVVDHHKGDTANSSRGSRSVLEISLDDEHPMEGSSSIHIQVSG